jgi:hypothetical protein
MALPSVRTIVAMSLLCSAAHAQPAPFDGFWDVIFSCGPARDGASGYTRRFPATVQGGVLHGEVGVRGQPSYLALDGSIPPNGQAILLGQGLTGDPDYTIGRVMTASPYSFHLQVAFTGSRGTGRRLETRACDAVLTRR